ncbi:MAG: zinc-binding dehydrogenase [Gaiellaceae bacterium]
MHRVAAAIHAWRRSGARPGDNAAILGGTPLALAMGAVALSAGSGRTALIDDDSACRAALAEHRAAAVATPNDDAGWDELRSALGGFGPDVVFECSGTPRSRLAAVELSRPAGSVVLLASDEQRVPMDLNLLVMGDKRVRGARGYAAAEAQAALELMARSCIDTSALVGASMEIDAFLVAAADDALASGLSSCQTTIVRWPADAQLPVTAQS